MLASVSHLRFWPPGSMEEIPWPTHFNWDRRNDHGQTALYAASYFGHIEVVKFLVTHGAKLNIECGGLGSVLHCAAYRGHIGVVKLLLDYGTDVSTGNKFENAIHAACRGAQEEAAVTILENIEVTQ